MHQLKYHYSMWNENCNAKQPCFEKCETYLLSVMQNYSTNAFFGLPTVMDAKSILQYSQNIKEVFSG